MLLQALYEYGKSHADCSLPTGCTLKSIKALIRLTEDGKYIGASATKENVVCPSIFTKAQAAGKCDPFVVNMAIVLGLDGPDNNVEKWRNKRPCYIAYWEKVKTENPDGEAVLNALTDADALQKISEGLTKCKIKPIDMVAFAVDERSICNDPRTIAFWEKENTAVTTDEESSHSELFGLDMITGETCELTEVLHKTKGLSSVGGMGSGDALTCFDKDSFLSYGLKKHQIAPMGKVSGDIIVDALNVLIEKSPLPIAGTKFVYWYKSDIPPQDDIIAKLLLDIEDDSDEADSSDEAEKERDALIRAKAVFDSIESGEAPGIQSLNNTYYILLLSAYSGRVMIRKYEEGDFEDLVGNVNRWYADTNIVNAGGSGAIKHLPIKTMLFGILEQKESQKPYEQMRNEFAGVLPSTMDSIIHGKQLPNLIVQKAILRIKSDLLSSSPNEDKERKGLPILNSRALQWLIAYIRRTERMKKEEYTMSELNPNHPNPAYHCGRLLAIYGEIQQTAAAGKPIGTTVVERFYSKMSATPAKVIEPLDALSIHHLAKIQSGLNPILKKMLNDAYASLGDEVPTSLNMSDRAYFALGYHQQIAEISKRKREAAVKRPMSDSDAEADNGTQEGN